MTPERMAELVARWVRLYTRGLPAPLAQRRSEEIDADLHDHIAHEREQGTGDRRLALSILSRMLRGLPADVLWRDRYAPTTARTAGRSAARVAVPTALVLLVPLVAMQLGGDVAWSSADFVFAGGLVGATALLYELVTTKAPSIVYRAAAGLAVATALLLVWVIGALGVIGEDGDPADLMYGGVLAVGIAGAAIARLRPRGMARALFATAAAHAPIAAIALSAGKHHAPMSSVAEILALNAFFAGLFAGSAWLFLQAARNRPARRADRA